MTLKEACEFGYDCGLETLEEVLTNIELHAISLFNISDIDSELYELNTAAADYELDDKIVDILRKLD